MCIWPALTDALCLWRTNSTRSVWDLLSQMSGVSDLPTFCHMENKHHTLCVSPVVTDVQCTAMCSRSATWRTNTTRCVLALLLQMSSVQRPVHVLSHGERTPYVVYWPCCYRCPVYSDLPTFCHMENKHHTLCIGPVVTDAQCTIS